MTSKQLQSESINDSQTIQNKKMPHVLMILDGFGHREDDKDNAIAAANTPNLDRIYQQYW